jgi:hypothetical protein
MIEGLSLTKLNKELEDVLKQYSCKYSSYTGLCRNIYNKENFEKPCKKCELFEPYEPNEEIQKMLLGF